MAFVLSPCPLPSRGPVIVHTTEVLPIVTRLLPSAEGWVEMLAESLRSSFHLRPSWRRRVVLYVEVVSRGIVLEEGAVPLLY